MMHADVEVMDNEICKHCRLMEVTSYATTLFGNGEIIGTENHFSCKNTHMCKYLRGLFEEYGKDSSVFSADYYTTPGCGDRSCDR